MAVKRFSVSNNLLGYYCQPLAKSRTCIVNWENSEGRIISSCPDIIVFLQYIVKSHKMKQEFRLGFIVFQLAYDTVLAEFLDQ